MTGGGVKVALLNKGTLSEVVPPVCSETYKFLDTVKADTSLSLSWLQHHDDVRKLTALYNMRGECFKTDCTHYFFLSQ